MYNPEPKTIDRDIKLCFDYNDVTYGMDFKGNYYELSCTTQKVKGSIDDYEFVWKWLKLHPYSIHGEGSKLNILILFRELIEEVIK